MLDLYMIKVRITCKTNQECVSGRWITREHIDCQFRITKELIGEQLMPTRDVQLINEMNDDLGSMIERYGDIKTEFGQPPAE